MKCAVYLKKVKDSKEFKDFMKEDPKAYLCSFFFTRDFLEKKDDTQVDFYSPKVKMIISFKVGKEVQRTPLGKKAETLTHKKFVPKPLKEVPKMDVDEMEPTLMDEMHNRGMTYSIEKLLAFVNITDGEVIWNCTAFLKGLGLLQAHVEDKTETVLFMDKKSFFDLLRFTKGGASSGTGPALGPSKVQPGQVKIIDLGKKEDSVKKEKK